MSVAVVSDLADVMASAGRLLDNRPRTGARGVSIEPRQVSWQIGDEPHPADRLAKEIDRIGAKIAIIGPDVPFGLALELASNIDQDYPEISTIVIHPPTPDLWKAALRSGIRDLVDPALIAVELEPALTRAIERSFKNRRELPPPAAPTAGKLIVVASPKGGCGKTTVATNLSAALAMAKPGRVVLVDLDLHFGDVAPALGILPERTIGQLVQTGQLDSTAIKVFLASVEPGLFVLHGAATPEEGDLVTDEHVVQVLQTLRHEFDYVIVDTPAGLDSRSLSAAEIADDLLLVTSFDVSAIRGLRHAIDTFDRLQLSKPRRRLILNRADSKVGLDVSDVERVLGMPATCHIPSTRSIPLAMNLGTPIVTSEPDSRVARQFQALAASLMPDSSDTAPRRRWKR